MNNITQWWNCRSLRFRLAAWYGLVGTLLLAAFSATLYFYVRDRMAQPLDHQLLRDLEEIRRNLDVLPDGRINWKGAEVSPSAAWTTTYPWFEVWDHDGQLVRRFWPFSENRVQELPGPPSRGRESLSVLNVAPDLRLRVLNVRYQTSSGQTWMLRVMRVHEPVADALHALRWIIVLALPIVIALLVAGGVFVTRRWLMPLDRMAAEASQISGRDFSRRLSVVNTRDELGRLGSVFNVTLDRLEGSFTALDRFVADASHELRTPLTTLRSVGEVGLRRARTPEEYQDIIASMLEEAGRLQLLVGRLLELATAEGGGAKLQLSELRLDSYVRGCVNERAILAEAREQRFVFDATPCSIVTDPVILRQALGNLLDNAIKYSPERSAIHITVLESDGAVEITVTDEGPGISEKNQPHITARFFRPDRGRDRSSGGFGLGLSITNAYMRVLGGELRYRRARTGGSAFSLVLPKTTAVSLRPVRA